MKPFAPNRLRLGNKGEDLAAELLQRKGYRILNRNFRARYGELDIVVQKGRRIVAVEVKTRTGNAFGTPEEAVTPHKLMEIEKTFHYFLTVKHIADCPLRIDVIAVDMDEEENCIGIRHIENVTG